MASALSVVLLSTNVEDVDPMANKWKILGSCALIGFLGWFAYFLWTHRM